MQQETVIVLDFGGQYNQLIARRVRECNVYCEIYSYRTDLAKIKAKNPKGIIFTGGPNSVYLEDSPTIDPEIFSWGVPVLGICYGSQLMMHLLGGHVCRAPEREYGIREWNIKDKVLITEGYLHFPVSECDVHCFYMNVSLRVFPPKKKRGGRRYSCFDIFQSLSCLPDYPLARRE